MAKWFKRTKVLFDQDRFVKLYINFPRAELIKGINKRVDRMFEQGAIKEVKKFNRLKVRKENSANNVIGIKEITNYLSGENSLSDAKEQIAIKTRQYAKRQTTWARGNMISWQNVEHKNLNSALNNFK
jgi:tRNA dimethylallyltransferase